MKFGIDIHRTIDTKTKFFAKFSQRIVSQGHECHIITGSQRTPQIELELKNMGIQYTHFFSIADYLIDQGKEIFWKNPTNPFFKDEDWNGTKADYCASKGIDLMIDDSKEYGKHFITPYMRII